MLWIRETHDGENCSLAALIDDFVDRYGKPFFLQVGAYDGVTADPLFPSIVKNSLPGCLVEPQHDAFERLRENYRRNGQTQCTFVQAAIAERDGAGTLYRIRPDITKGPEWMHQLASFHKDVLLRHSSSIPNLESMIVETRVPAVTFETLFADQRITRVDLLQVDTEGFDARVLELFDIPLRKPALVSFEHKHLSTRDYLKVASHLCENAYAVFVDPKRPDDTTAFRLDRFPQAGNLRSLFSKFRRA